MDTSQAARDSVVSTAGEIAQRVYEAIEAHPSTCDELEQSLGLRHQSCSARIRDLAKAKRIIESGITRPTRSGRQAVVWQTRDQALDMMERLNQIEQRVETLEEALAKI